MKQTKIKPSEKIRIPKPNIPNKKNSKFVINDGAIKKLRQRVNEKITFSFKFFDRNTQLFNLGSFKNRSSVICGEWFITLFDTLKEVSSLSKIELVSQRQHYDFHEHDWNKLKIRYQLEDDFLEQVNCVQFRLSTSKGRVHGFMVGNNFYVVWLDPYHNLYPDERFGGEKYYAKPETCFEKLSKELIRLKSENVSLERLLDEKTS